MTDFPPPIPAATLVLMRERPDGPPELLMVERAETMVFAAGAMVFPGGRVDPGDHFVAANPALVTVSDDPDDAAGRVAAIRECVEEVGIAVGFSAPPAVVAELRVGLARGEAFGALLRDAGLTLDLAALLPFARWLPKHRKTRRYDTRFYVAAAPADAVAAADGGESVLAMWISAEAVLADAAAERRNVIFPTARNLERLALFGSVAEVHAHVAQFPVRTMTAWTEERAGERWLRIPEGMGYPVTEMRLEPAKRE